MNLAIFASGRGSNLQALLTTIQRGELPARIRVVVSNNSDAGALEIARRNEIPAVHLSQRHFTSEAEYCGRLLGMLEEYKVDFIALAGYMKKLPAELINRFRNRIVNVHPALLPAFGGKGMYGMHVHEAVIAAGVKISGATVHIVTEEYDAGPIVLQKAVEVLPDDTPQSLAARVLAVEHEIYPHVLKAFAEHRIELNGQRAWIKPK
jgi:phosphoribosylglycinamide formyltransferase-1